MFACLDDKNCSWQTFGATHILNTHFRLKSSSNEHENRLQTGSFRSIFFSILLASHRSTFWAEIVQIISGSTMAVFFQITFNWFSEGKETSTASVDDDDRLLYIARTSGKMEQNARETVWSWRLERRTKRSKNKLNAKLNNQLSTIITTSADISRGGEWSV